MIDYYQSNIDLTLLGCGFLGTYHLGALYLLAQVWPRAPYNRICGSSCGGLLGALVAAGLSLERVLELGIGIVNRARHCLFAGKPWRRLARGQCSLRALLERQLEAALPNDAHARCSGKLGLSISELGPPLRNNFVSHFRDRRELIEAVTAGCFIPLWSGEWRPPLYGGRPCLDGAYTNNRPKFPRQAASRQVEVCPFNGKIDVSPKLSSFSFGTFRLLDTRYHLTWPNLCRTLHAMLPFPSRVYRAYLFHGHRDMKAYLIREGLIVCRKCYEARGGAGLEPDTEKRPPSAPHCAHCAQLIERVRQLRVPKSFYQIIS